jgi:hypothetical protein
VSRLGQSLFPKEVSAGLGGEGSISYRGLDRSGEAADAAVGAQRRGCRGSCEQDKKIGGMHGECGLAVAAFAATVCEAVRS